MNTRMVSTRERSISLAAGVVVALLGLAVPTLRWLYDYAWFVGFAVSGGVYVVLMRGRGGNFEGSDSSQ